MSDARQTVKAGKTRLARFDNDRVFSYTGKGVIISGVRRIVKEN